MVKSNESADQLKSLAVLKLGTPPFGMGLTSAFRLSVKFLICGIFLTCVWLKVKGMFQQWGTDHMHSSTPVSQNYLARL